MNFPKENWVLAFCFPTVNKRIENVEELVIEPLWEVHDEHFVGLYRIAVKLAFSDQNSTTLHEEAILIEAIDVNEQQGYFEYAVPFEGNGVVETINVSQVHWQTDEQQLILQWKSDISFQQPVQEVEVIQPIKVPEIVEQQEVQQPVIEHQEPNVDQVVVETAVEKKESHIEQVANKELVPAKHPHIFLNDLVEQYSIWHSSDFRPQQQSDNNE